MRGRSARWPALAILMLLSGACSNPFNGSSDESSPEPEASGPMVGTEVVIGGTTAPTDQIMSAMLVAAFADRGATVIDRSNNSDDALNRDDLVAGRLDATPEDLSTGWFIHLGQTEEFTRTAELAEVLSLGDMENGIVWTDYSGFDAAVVPIADPATGRDENGGTVTMERLAALLEANFDARVCLDRATLKSPDGLVRFEAATGYTVPEGQLDVLEPDEPLRRLIEKECDVALSSGVDGLLAGTDLAIVDRLDDSATPPLVFRPRPTAFMMNAELYAEQASWLPVFIESLMVTLDSGTMSALLAELDGETPAIDIARGHLARSGLIDP